MKPCDCDTPHEHRRIVLTGGPAAGKSAVLLAIRQSFCGHVRVLPGAAGMVYGGGFPRDDSVEARRAAQRAIFFIQRELETVADARNDALVLCDRGTVDGAAYWPGPDDYWSSLGTTRDDELARYDVVIHLHTPTLRAHYYKQNPLRIESLAEAAAIDERIARAWDGHPHRFIVAAADDFIAKAVCALDIVRAELPECCCRRAVSIGGERAATAQRPNPPT